MRQGQSGLWKRARGLEGKKGESEKKAPDSEHNNIKINIHIDHTAI